MVDVDISDTSDHKSQSDGPVDGGHEGVVANSRVANNPKSVNRAEKFKNFYTYILHKVGTYSAGETENCMGGGEKMYFRGG